MAKYSVNSGEGKQAGRHYLLLQMPCGNFGRELQAALIDAGQDCTRIAFNGGDFMGALGQHFVSYRKTAAEWPLWIEAFAQSQGITDLVLYGDCRAYHCAAIDVLRPLGIRIHVLEEGYLRPNWITCEPNGVNGFSELTALDVRALPECGAAAPEAELPPSFMNYCLLGFMYYFFSFMLWPAFPRYVPHRDVGILSEAWLWTGRLASWPLRRLRLKQLYETIAAKKKPVHLVLLQLNGDSQIKVHSDYRSVAEFVRYCISEFAASGVDDALLVFKNHPLDNGVIPLGAVIRREAENHRLSGRVLFADGGNLVSLLGGAVSAISINSTACHQALRRGIPTLLEGRTVFNHPLITSHVPMREFFRLRPVKDRADYDRLIHYMMHNCQINGGFYNREGRRIVLPNLVAALLRGRPESPPCQEVEREASAASMKRHAEVPL